MASMNPPYPACPLDLEDSPLVDAYRRQTPQSAKLAKRARQIFPSGITHDARHIEPHGIPGGQSAAARQGRGTPPAY